MKFKFNLRTIMFIIIIIICIVAINVGAYMQFFYGKEKKKEKDPDNTTTQKYAEELVKIEKGFSNIFKNSLDYQGNRISLNGITKVESNNDLIFTLYKKEEVVDNKYSMKIDIPYINISNFAVEKINKEIDSIFAEKARDIILNATNNTIYNVEYMSYINTNILSLVIRSTLKEGNNPQRVIVQTYNYNLSTNEQINLQQIIEIKGLNKTEVEQRIQEKIKNANEEASHLKNLGYNVYTRDVENEMYKTNNTNVYFIGKDNHLYIVYPYGNSNFTSETDVIVF